MPSRMVAAKLTAMSKTFRFLRKKFLMEPCQYTISRRIKKSVCRPLPDRRD